MPPTRIRRGVLLFACTLSMITYLDRVAIASAARNIVQALSLQSIADLKWTFTAFALAYALFEVPTEWMGDIFGPRLSLLRIVMWWSAFTVLTAAVGRFAATVGAFMNMGAGLAGALAGWVTGSVLEHAIVARAAQLGVDAAQISAEGTTAALLHGYHVNFYSFAALYVVAFLCWFKIDPTRPIASDPLSHDPQTRHIPAGHHRRHSAGHHCRRSRHAARAEFLTRSRIRR